MNHSPFHQTAVASPTSRRNFLWQSGGGLGGFGGLGGTGGNRYPGANGGDGGGWYSALIVYETCQSCLGNKSGRIWGNRKGPYRCVPRWWIRTGPIRSVRRTYVRVVPTEGVAPWNRTSTVTTNILPIRLGSSPGIAIPAVILTRAQRPGG